MELSHKIYHKFAFHNNTFTIYLNHCNQVNVLLEVLSFLKRQICAKFLDMMAKVVILFAVIFSGLLISIKYLFSLVQLFIQIHTLHM